MKPVFTLLFAAISLTNICFAQNFKWGRAIGGLNADMITSVAIDPSGNVISTGAFTSTADLDPGPSVFNLVSTGAYDGFIQKMDANGSLVWAKKIGSTSNDYGNAVKTDASGNIYVMGVFRGTVDFDPGVGTNNLSSASAQYDAIFILKLDATGNFVWAIKREAPVPNDRYAGECDFELDGNNNMYLTYSFGDMTSYTYTLVEKTDNTGNTLWTNMINTVGSFNPFVIDQSIALTSTGDIVLAGSFHGDVDFYPSNSQILSSIGTENAYMLKLSNSGNFVFVKKLTSSISGFSRAYDVAIDANDNIFVSGSFSGTVDFEPGTGIQNVNAVSTFGSSMFLVKLTPNAGFEWVNNYCDGNAQINSITTDASGSIYATGHFEGKCDFSTVAPYVTINSYILTADAFVLKVDKLGTYNWIHQIGGPGTDIGNGVAINNAGEVYTVGSFTGTANFNYNSIGGVNILSAGDMDGFVHKAVNCPSFDLTVSKTNVTLTSNENNTTTYQWINCNGNTPIAGATGKSFTATANGNYAVVLNNGGCIDTSACINVSGVGIRDIIPTLSTVYPNPTNGDIHIKLDKTYNSVVVEISSAIGQIISKKQYNNPREIDAYIEGANGLYYITIVADGMQRSHHTIMKGQ